MGVGGHRKGAGAGGVAGVAGGDPARRVAGARSSVSERELRYLARQEGTSIGTILSRELEDMASARVEELAAAVPSVAVALQFTGGAEG
ncbi:MAG TPA: hypothetical protein VGQ65_18760 [Thermoanaerobaculia bacterium]|nr:hypothetical protein [Thermoanaerobaculia bacterium]